VTLKLLLPRLSDELSLGIQAALQNIVIDVWCLFGFSSTDGHKAILAGHTILMFTGDIHNVDAQDCE